MNKNSLNVYAPVDIFFRNCDSSCKYSKDKQFAKKHVNYLRAKGYHLPKSKLRLEMNTQNYYSRNYSMIYLNKFLQKYRTLISNMTMFFNLNFLREIDMTSRFVKSFAQLSTTLNLLKRIKYVKKLVVKDRSGNDHNNTSRLAFNREVFCKSFFQMKNLRQIEINEFYYSKISAAKIVKNLPRLEKIIIYALKHSCKIASIKSVKSSEHDFRLKKFIRISNFVTKNLPESTMMKSFNTEVFEVSALNSDLKKTQEKILEHRNIEKIYENLLQTYRDTYANPLRCRYCFADYDCGCGCEWMWDQDSMDLHGDMNNPWDSLKDQRNFYQIDGFSKRKHKQSDKRYHEKSRKETRNLKKKRLCCDFENLVI